MVTVSMTQEQVAQRHEDFLKVLIEQVDWLTNEVTKLKSKLEERK
jgi:hypothetical protein